MQFAFDLIGVLFFGDKKLLIGAIEVMMIGDRRLKS
jgi:hypothetical protein